MLNFEESFSKIKKLLISLFLFFEVFFNTHNGFVQCGDALVVDVLVDGPMFFYHSLYLFIIDHFGSKQLTLDFFKPIYLQLLFLLYQFLQLLLINIKVAYR